MKSPKKPDLNSILAKLQKNVDTYWQLAPYEKRTPVMGIRQYEETFYDNEWQLILDVLKDAKHLTTLFSRE